MAQMQSYGHETIAVSTFICDYSLLHKNEIIAENLANIVDMFMKILRVKQVLVFIICINLGDKYLLQHNMYFLSTTLFFIPFYLKITAKS